MQSLGWSPRLSSWCMLNNTKHFPYSFERPIANARICLLPLRSFSTSSDYPDQSRGGLPRFFSETFPFSKGDIVRVGGDQFWHMTKVLRLNSNDRVELFNGKGGLLEGCIQSVDRAGADILVTDHPKLLSPLGTQWHVFSAFGTLKGGRADWLVEKCTELGANSITPLLTERSPSIGENRVDRLRRVTLAGAKQCQRLHELNLNPPIKFDGLLPLVAQSKLSFVAAAGSAPLFNSLGSLKREPSGMMIIGPEGDFTEIELRMILEAGATPVSLGPHRLRVETATISVLAALMLWSDSQEMLNK